MLPPPPPNYHADSSAVDSGYNVNSYEGEKWQEEYWDPSYSKHTAYNNTKVKRKFGFVFEFVSFRI